MSNRLPGNAFHARFILLAVLLIPPIASAQVAGDSVNMVSGTEWPGGDPFLQRQNEPSISVSSANPMHLLAGANDYRSVDVPNPFQDGEQKKMAGDAWQGVFKSYDGGQTWKSYLMPGYPQDTSAEGLSSAAQKRDATGRAWFNASADPVVRAGTDGMFYFAGIVFRRGTSEGRVVLNRFIDLNDREGGDPLQGADSIRWIDASVIDEGSAGTYFADKPWIAVDVPRPGTPTCTIQRFGRTVAGGAVYAVWARIYSDTWADIMFSRSLDCGATWSPPLKLNDQKSQASQGASISVDPRTGYVYVAWRRFGIVGASPKQEEDAIFAVRSFSGGAKFTNPRLVTTFIPYEQDQGNLRFRTEAFPTIATSTDATGTKSWTHVAWAQRGANGDGQVVMTNVVVTAPPKTFDEWTDPLDGWKIPPDPVDVAPVQDRPGGSSFTRGHQFMPALTFGQGRLVLVYYDSRLDHTRTYYTPHLDPCAPVGSCWTPNAQGRWYDEERGPLGERTGVDWVTAELDDATMTQTRHTIDVRMATATPSASPVFTSAPLSRMPFGERGDEHDLYPGGTAPGFGAPIQVLDVGTVPAALRKLQDLQVNPPNLPMFKNGTVSFIGDYIDVQGPVFVKTATGWAFDIAPRAAPVFHAVWTSNQDVVPPANGDWTRYTPPARAQGTVSVYDPGQTLQTGCDPGYTGSRNQNIYTARISDGLVVASPQNAKRLVTGKDRTFVVSAFNATSTARTVQFSFAQPLPAGVRASFRPDVMALTPTVTVTIPPRSYAVQTAFLRVLDGYDPTLVNPATTFVNVQEVGGGLSGAVTLNPPGLAYPAAVESGEVTTVQLSAASLYYANLSNANLSNANLSNANLSNANLSNANLSNANLSNANLSNADPSAFTLEAAHLSNANLSNANLSNANLSNANLSNANLSNANLSNANLSNAALADVDYEVTNTGNTAQGFDVGLLATSLGTSAPIQLIVSRPYGKPIANGCSLLVQPDNQLVVNAGVVDPSLDPASQAPLATIAVLPGEKVRVTLRTYLTPYEARTLATRIAPFVAPQADPAAARNALVVTQPVAPLTAQVGNTFTLDLKATGGVGSLTWTVDGGTVPAPGFDARMLSQGKLSVTPLHAGNFNFTLKVVDSATPLPNQMYRDVTMTVAKGTSTTTLAPLPATALYGSALTLQATVAPAGATGTVTFLDGGATLGTAAVQSDGTATFTVPAPGLGVGLHAVAAVFGGNDDVDGSGTPTQQVRVKVDTRLLLGTSPAAPVYGTPTSLTATLASVPPGAPSPTVPAYFTEGGVTIGSGSFVAGTATSAPLLLTGGNHLYGVTFDGDDAWAPASISGATVTVARAAILDVKVSTSKSPSYYGETVTLRATVTFSAGTPGGTVTFLVNGVELPGAASAVVADPVIPGAPITGTAVASVSTLGVGSYTIDARYAGGTNFENARPLTTVTQEVRGTTSASLTSSPNPSALGAAVTLACTVSSTGGIPPGAPTFWDGGLQLTGTPTSVAGTSTSVTWSLQTTALASGLRTLYCQYPGAGGFDAASASTTQQVGPVPTSTTLTVTPTSATYGQAVTLKAAVVPVSPATGVPTGTVTFLDGATSTSAGTTLGTATAATGWTLTVSTLKVGSHPITARYGGDPLLASSTSAATTVTVKSPWTFTGFLTPLKTAGTWDAPTNSGSQNFGSAVPIKWQLTDATGAFVSDLATTTALEAWPNTACKGAPPSGSTPVVLYRPTSGATGGSTFRYGSNTFIFNWDTTSGVSRGCFNIVLTLSDGTVKATLLTLK